MNIFYTNSNSTICAQEHCDKHTVKMILEYAQLLSTAHRYLSGEQITEVVNNRKKTLWKLEDSMADGLLYKATHINHPSAIWCRESSANYYWLATLLHTLCIEYTHRYDRIHKTQQIGLVDVLRANIPSPLQDCEKLFTPPTLAMPDEYKQENHEKAYQHYILGEKSHILNWKNRKAPFWYIIHENIETLVVQ